MRFTPTKAEREIQLAKEFKIHMDDLKSLGYKSNTLKPLQTLENKAHQMAEDECNGVKEYTAEQWEEVRRAVLVLFRKDLMAYGFFINTDPRGYALKLHYEDNKVNNPNNEQLIRFKDWGGYGILSPDFEI